RGVQSKNRPHKTATFASLLSDPRGWMPAGCSPVVCLHPARACGTMRVARCPLPASGRRSMKIVGLDTWIVSVPYIHDEISSRVARGGVTDTIVRLTADNGLTGWGECSSGPDAASIEQAVQSARPFVIGHDP